LKIVNEETLALEHAIESLGIAGTEELEHWQAEELEYLQTLGKEDDYDVMAIAYVKRPQRKRRNEGNTVTALQDH